MTPRAFALLVDRLNAQRKHALYCAAVGASATYNVARADKNDPIITPEKLLGEDAPASRQKAPAVMPWQDMKAYIKHVINPAFGGKDLTNG